MQVESGSLILQSQTRESGVLDERRGFQEGTMGIYAPGALGIAIANSLGTNQLITRSGSKSAEIFQGEVDLKIADEKGETRPFPARFSTGLVDAYTSGNLPEVIIACPNADRIPGLVQEIVELTFAMAKDGVLQTTQGGELIGIDQLPSIVLASNGILDESMREQLREAMIQISQDARVGEALAQNWLGKTVRGLSYISAERSGSGLNAIYKPPDSGVITLTGGSDRTRARVVELTTGKKAIRFLDRGEKTVEFEWRKAYTNLMTNVAGLAVCFDRRKDMPRLDIPVGRILQRMKQAEGVTFIEVEGAQEWCERLGKAYFTIAREKGLFTEFSTWEEFNQRVFLDPIKDPKAFYAHTPSSLQMLGNQIRSGRLPDGVPGNESQIISSLLKEAEQRSDQLLQEKDTLRAVEAAIAENIALLKEVYRKPRVTEPNERIIQRRFNQSSETVHIVFNSNDLGMTRDQVKPYGVKAPDVDIEGGDVVPMTAEVFTYGPENIPGNVAFITNGAGFTLEALDRCVAAGVRLGFMSDLRLQFEEGKYYLAMKMALSANPAIDTIAIDVLTTLGTCSDVARAIERIAHEHPSLRFVAKVEGREQEKGIEIFQRLKKDGLRIHFTQGNEDAPASEIQPLTLDQMVRTLRKLDGMGVDVTYDIYELFQEEQLQKMAESAFHTRLKQILLPTLLRRDTQEMIDFLRENGMLTPESVFGREFTPAKEGKALTGKPVVVIAGYGETPRLQAKLMRQAGTEVVLLHPKIQEKVSSLILEELHALGIRTYMDPEQLQKDLNTSYPEGVDLIGTCYEPYKPETGNGGIYRERVENAVDLLIRLKTDYNLSVRSILIPTEMVPTAGTKAILNKCKSAGIWFIGPNSPGMSFVDEKVFREQNGMHLKVAQIPAQCVSAGDIAVFGVGGTMLFETLTGLKNNGRGIRTAISLGGDRTRGINARDVALIAEHDPNIKHIMYIGEPGGIAAQELAEVMKAGLITKPVIVKIIGHQQPDNCYVGHAGAVTHGVVTERASVKEEKLRESGAIIVHTPEQMAQVVTYLEAHPRFGQIDTQSSAFQQAKSEMERLLAAENVIVENYLFGSTRNG